MSPAAALRLAISIHKDHVQLISFLSTLAEHADTSADITMSDNCDSETSSEETDDGCETHSEHDSCSTSTEELDPARRPKEYYDSLQAFPYPPYQLPIFFLTELCAIALRIQVTVGEINMVPASFRPKMMDQIILAVLYCFHGRITDNFHAILDVPGLKNDPAPSHSLSFLGANIMNIYHAPPLQHRHLVLAHACADLKIMATSIRQRRLGVFPIYAVVVSFGCTHDRDGYVDVVKYDPKDNILWRLSSSLAFNLYNRQKFSEDAVEVGNLLFGTLFGAYLERLHLDSLKSEQSRTLYEACAEAEWATAVELAQLSEKAFIEPCATLSELTSKRSTALQLLGQSTYALQKLNRGMTDEQISKVADQTVATKVAGMLHYPENGQAL